MARAILLSAGRDPSLLFTRRKVLEAAGYSVVTAATPIELISQFFSGDFDLAILCHTIPFEEKQKISSLIRGHSPSTSILALSDVLGQFWSFVDETVANDPVALLAAIPELIQKSGHRQGSFGAS